jgi:hypothetical protein
MADAEDASEFFDVEESFVTFETCAEDVVRALNCVVAHINELAAKMENPIKQEAMKKKVALLRCVNSSVIEVLHQIDNLIYSDEPENFIE